MSVQDVIPRSRITLKYQTTINGQQEDVTIPFRLLVVGDFSQGLSKEPKQPLDLREMYSLNGRNLNEVMANMKLQMFGTDGNPVYFETMQDLTPDGLALHIPDIKKLIELKTQLLEVQATLENKQALRDALDRVIATDNGLESLRKELLDKKLALQELTILGKYPEPGGTFTIEAPAGTETFDPPLSPDGIQKLGEGESPLEVLLTAMSDDFARINISENRGASEHFLLRVGALTQNVYFNGDKCFDKRRLSATLTQVDELINQKLLSQMASERFKNLAQVWLGLENLVQNTDFTGNINIDILDVSKEELREDFARNSENVSSSAFFKRVYIEQYDQYGGVPFGAIVGLYEFENTSGDINWLSTMAQLANASHSPFISAASSRFFGVESAQECAQLKGLPVILNQPQYQKWNAFRKTEEAAYVGLTFPRFLLRAPYEPEQNPSDAFLTYNETVDTTKDTSLWGNSAILLARNLIRSFITSGWCQYLRGPKGGGNITGLPQVRYNLHGQNAIKPAVEIVIPDYRELEFSQSGFIPLIYKKDNFEATFFSVQSIKVPKRFKDPKDTQNSQLVSNLAYTFSVTRIAHYVKLIMRDNIGTSADSTYTQRILDNWLKMYVTEVTNPDDLTLRHYPFKAAKVQVTSQEGAIGWYDCTISILPHIQFEGMNVELCVESRLGKAA